MTQSGKKLPRGVEISSSLLMLSLLTLNFAGGPVIWSHLDTEVKPGLSCDCVFPSRLCPSCPTFVLTALSVLVTWEIKEDSTVFLTEAMGQSVNLILSVSSVGHIDHCLQVARHLSPYASWGLWCHVQEGDLDTRWMAVFVLIAITKIISYTKMDHKTNLLGFPAFS